MLAFIHSFSRCYFEALNCLSYRFLAFLLSFLGKVTESSWSSATPFLKGRDFFLSFPLCFDKTGPIIKGGLNSSQVGFIRGFEGVAIDPEAAGRTESISS